MVVMGEVKVGVLAAESGLTVRTLHHYDRIGLVSPSSRTASGHRLYVDTDIERLYRVAALRQLGLPLEVIGDLLDDVLSLREVLAKQQAYLADQISELTRVKSTVDLMLADSSSPRTSDLLDVMRKVNGMADTFSKYFDADQMARLAQRRTEIGEDEIKRVEQAWPDLIARVDAAIAADLDPTSDQARALADEWMGLLHQFHGGDDSLRDSLYRMQSENTEQIQAEHGGPSPASMQFIQAVQAARPQ
ncbi:MerR family transcriptional regulator [Nocardia callitridis]|uniref:HTH merR-type domain-containing protein n=1 Tax=Nocardia callitridis TaxID=648753 RepID=A0ABP9JT32_9NOCA